MKKLIFALLASIVSNTLYPASHDQDREDILIDTDDTDREIVEKLSPEVQDRRNARENLRNALEENNVEKVKVLLEQELVDANILLDFLYQIRPLHIAALKNNAKMIELLLEHKALKNLRTRNGAYPVNLTQDPACQKLLSE